MTPFAGIDPGKTGALAFIGADTLAVYDMPYVGSELDIAGLQAMFIEHRQGLLRADLEYQQAMPKQGVTSVFTLGVSYGALKAFLACQQVAFDTPRPLAWKRFLGLPPGADKEVSRAKALQLFPLAAPYLRRVKDHGRAEALLLAEHARRKYLGGQSARDGEPGQARLLEVRW